MRFRVAATSLVAQRLPTQGSPEQLGLPREPALRALFNATELDVASLNGSRPPTGPVGQAR